MKKIILGVFMFMLFFPTQIVNAENLGVGFFCSKGLYSEDDKIVTYDLNKYDNTKYNKGDEIICYLSVIYDGDTSINKVEFNVINNENFEFEKFEKSSLWDETIVNDKNIVLNSKNGVTGNFVIGKLYYKMLNDGDDLILEVSPVCLNDYDVVGSNILEIINDSSRQEKPNLDEDYIEKPAPVEEVKEDKTLIYILCGIIAFLLLTNIIQLLIIRRMNKTF